MTKVKPLAIAAVLIATTFVGGSQAKTNRSADTIYKSGEWEVSKSWVTLNNAWACSIGGETHVDGKFGLINFKHIPGDDIVYFMIIKQGWKFPGDEKHSVDVPLELTFDNTDLRIGVEAARGYMGGDHNQFGMVDFFVRPSTEETFVPRFMEAFAHADKMMIKFKEGTEAQWSFDMKGSRGAASAFAKCLADLSREHPTTQPYSETPPSQPYDASKASAKKNEKDI